MAIVYTCFGFSDLHPALKHMTHKYLGEQSDENIEQIHEIVDRFINTYAESRPLPEIAFSRLDFLGPKHVPAMCIRDTGMKQYLFLDLREQLHVFAKDQFEYWTPHISNAGFEPITVKFDRYFIVVKGGPIWGFKLETR